MIKLLNESSIYDGTKIWDKSREGYIQYTGAGTVQFIEGEKIIEEKPEMDYRNEILKMNLPFNEFCYFQFEISGSLLFRDYLFSFEQLGNVARFAKSNRFLGNRLAPSVEYLADTPYVKFLSKDGWNFLSKELKDCWNEYKLEEEKYDKKEIDYDNFRLSTPYFADTQFYIGVNLKDLCRILAFTRVEFSSLYRVYAPQFYGAVPGLEEFFNEYFERNGVEDTFYAYLETENATKPYGDKVKYESYGDVGMILLSQIIRQSKSIFRGYLNLLKGKDLKDHTITGATIVPLKVLQTEGRLDSTIKTRSCWFSMSDASVGKEYTWSGILERFYKSTPESELGSLLPCNPKNGCLKCIYKEDTVFRNLGTELQNAPCAFLMEDRSLIEKRASDYGNSATLDFYRKVWDIAKMKDNPNNPLQIKYHSMLKEKGLSIKTSAKNSVKSEQKELIISKTISKRIKA